MHKRDVSFTSPLTGGRTVVFIDGGYVRNMLAQSGIKVDLLLLAKALSGASELLRVYYYDARPKDGSLDGFLAALRCLEGFEVRLGTLIEYDQRRYQKGVDGLLSLDLTRLSMGAGGFDNAVLVTGDGDFCPAAEHAKSLGVRIVGAYWRSMSQNLYQTCDNVIQLESDFLETIRFGDSSFGSRACPQVCLSPGKQGSVNLPATTRAAAQSGHIRILRGEVVEVQAGAEATVCDGGIAIAREGSSVHALKGATVYLSRGVSFTGTRGFHLIPFC